MGHDRQRLRQTYRGLDVVGATADAEVVGSGVMTVTVSGSLAYSLENDIPDANACKRNKDDLMQVARQYLQDNHLLSQTDTASVQKIETLRKIHFEGEVGVARLIYELGFLVKLVPTPCRPFFIIDACDLTVTTFFDRIHNMTLALPRRAAHIQPVDQCDTTTAGPPATTASPTGACPSSAPAQGVGGNPKTGRRVYGQDKPNCLYTQVSNGRCTKASKYAQVIDLEGTTSRRGRSPVEFDCAEGYSDPVNEAFGVASDAFYYGDSTGQLYEQWYGFYALGYSPELRIHYSQCYDNAFWDGTHMTFGDGCNFFYPLVSQDMVAHELGHGITTLNSNLQYRGQSGGINEAFSDMSGEAAELFSTNSNDWQVGRELFKGNGALRYFERPSQDGRSIDSADDYRSGMDVHYSSGVFNRAFFQLVTEQNVPMRQAYEIFLQANRVIWRETTNFQDGACGAMKAAYDLGYDVNKVKNAFAVVAIDLSSCNYQDFQQSISAGEVRSEVKASSLRNPVFALDAVAENTVVIDAFSEDSAEVTVSVTSDAAGADVLVSGIAPFVLDTTAETAYFKVSASNSNDVVFDVSVEVVS